MIDVTKKSRDKRLFLGFNKVKFKVQIPTEHSIFWQ